MRNFKLSKFSTVKDRPTELFWYFFLVLASIESLVLVKIKYFCQINWCKCQMNRVSFLNPRFKNQKRSNCMCSCKMLFVLDREEVRNKCLSFLHNITISVDRGYHPHEPLYYVQYRKCLCPFFVYLRPTFIKGSPSGRFSAIAYYICSVTQKVA